MSSVEAIRIEWNQPNGIQVESFDYYILNDLVQILVAPNSADDKITMFGSWSIALTTKYDICMTSLFRSDAVSKRKNFG